MHSILSRFYKKTFSFITQHKFLAGVPFLLACMWIGEQILTYTIFYYQAHQLGPEICATVKQRDKPLVYREYYLTRLVSPAPGLHGILQKWQETDFDYCTYDVIMDDPYGKQAHQLMVSPYVLHIAFVNALPQQDQVVGGFQLRLDVNPLGNLVVILTDPAITNHQKQMRASGATPTEAFVDRWSRLSMLGYLGYNRSTLLHPDGCYMTYLPDQNPPWGGFFKYDSEGKIRCPD